MMNEKMVDIITQYGVVLVHGMIQKTMPTPSFSLDDIFDTPVLSNNLDKKGKKEKESPKTKASTVSASGQVLRELMEIYTILFD